ncbi:MAG: DUF72 domain-containing protein [Planctomycetota bacterium]|nr:DUF72 domain-containing protein [Planctomycetota bacterium]
MPISTNSNKVDWNRLPYRLGCPVWTCKEWGNVVYPSGTAQSQSLRWYSQMFGTVEGSSTFYAMPSTETFEKWASECVDTFQFSFKFPQRITHEAELVDCDGVTREFLQRLKILYEVGRLGITFVQLGPRFSARSRNALATFLKRLPQVCKWAVEVRHGDWFDEGPNEKWLDKLLVDLNVDRVLFDSRPLFSLPPTDPIEIESQKRKPKTPFRTTVTGKHPFVRVVGRNKPDEVTTYWQEWSKQIAAWIVKGLEPWIFTHAPDDAVAPELARWMHRLIGEEVAKLDPLKDWPELPTLINKGMMRPRQMPLF